MEQDNAQLNAVMEQEKTMNSATMEMLIQGWVWIHMPIRAWVYLHANGSNYHWSGCLLL
jgi:hypothetical protein